MGASSSFDTARARLYLDTADLIAIGDGKVSQDTAEQLVRSCEQNDAILLVSRWHVVDIREAPPDAAQRVFEAAERFPMLGVISLDDEGASVQGLRRAVDLIDEHPPGVILVNELATLVTDVDRSIERLDPAIPERFSNSVRRLLHEVLRQETEEAAMSAAMSYLHKNRRKFPPEKHEMISAMMLSAFRNAREPGNIGLFLNMNKSLDDAKEPEICPPASTHIGRHLGRLVDQRRRRQRDREVGRGDLVDRHHVEFAPYVDIFTGDKDVCAWIEEWRSQIPYPRKVVAVKSNHLQLVIESLPKTGDHRV